MAIFNFGFFGNQEHRVFNYKRTRSTASRTQAIIGIITLLLIALVLIYVTKIYGLLGV